MEPGKKDVALVPTPVYCSINYVGTDMESKVADTTREVEREGQEGRFKA
jgi:hypothetical protein